MDLKNIIFEKNYWKKMGEHDGYLKKYNEVEIRNSKIFETLIISEFKNFLLATRLSNFLNFLESNPINSAGNIPTSDKTEYLPPIKLL